MGETTENVLLCSSGPCHRASQGVKEEEEKRGTGCVFTADRFRSDKQPHYGGEIESFVVVLPCPHWTNMGQVTGIVEHRQQEDALRVATLN